MEEDCQEAQERFAQQRKWQAEAVEAADFLLSRVVQALQPTREQWQARQDVIARVQAVLAGMPDFQPPSPAAAASDGDGCLAQLLVFGSFCSSLYHKGSDLDLTITGCWRDRYGRMLEMHRMAPVQLGDMLHRIRRALVASRVALDSAEVINARVPLVFFTDAATGVQVDISVCNHNGAFKSCFVRELVAFDWRFESLFRLVKLWAESKDLNDPKSGSLNSWSITQMCIFHLQRHRPPILPPLWLFFQHAPPPPEQLRPLEQPGGGGGGGGSSGGGARGQQAACSAGAPYHLLDTCEQQRRAFQPAYHSGNGGAEGGAPGGGGGGGCGNAAGLLELLASFFVRYAEVLRQWLDLGRHRPDKMSTWLGDWHDGGAWWRQAYLVGFEDPFDAGDNTARTLGTTARNDGGCTRLQGELERACNACMRLDDVEDVKALMASVYGQDIARVLAAGFDPISDMQEQQQRLRQQQSQARAEAGRERQLEWERALRQRQSGAGGQQRWQQQAQLEQQVEQLQWQAVELEQQQRQQLQQLLADGALMQRGPKQPQQQPQQQPPQQLQQQPQPQQRHSEPERVVDDGGGGEALEEVGQLLADLGIHSKQQRLERQQFERPHLRP